MRESEFNLRHLFTIVAIVAAVLVVPIRLHAQSSAVTHIQSYYQQLMPTIQQAGRLSVRERDKRFTPAISSAFDLPTMTRLAVGPAWQSFSPAQQAAVRDAFAKFIIADYASQVKDYSGESFVVDPNSVPEPRGGGEIVKTRLLQPGGRTVSINYLVRGGRVVDLGGGHGLRARHAGCREDRRCGGADAGGERVPAAG